MTISRGRIPPALQQLLKSRAAGAFGKREAAVDLFTKKGYNNEKEKVETPGMEGAKDAEGVEGTKGAEDAKDAEGAKSAKNTKARRTQET